MQVDVLTAAVGSPCPYCGKVMHRESGGARHPTRDHVLPRSRGGNFQDPKNRMIVCRQCNEDKADMTLIEFAGWLLAMRDPRYERVRRLTVDLIMAGAKEHALAIVGEAV